MNFSKVTESKVQSDMDSIPTSLNSDDPPFGTFQLPWWGRLLISLCHKMPTGRMGKLLRFLLRKPVLKLCQEPVDVIVKGLKLRLYPHSNLSCKRLMTTHFLMDGEERSFFVKKLPQNAHIIDIGANVGGYSILLFQQRSDLRSTLVEPDPILVSRLTKNLSLNQFQTRCQVKSVAISDHTGTVNLNRSPGRSGAELSRTDF